MRSSVGGNQVAEAWSGDSAGRGEGGRQVLLGKVRTGSQNL